MKHLIVWNYEIVELRLLKYLVACDVHPSYAVGNIWMGWWPYACNTKETSCISMRDVHFLLGVGESGEWISKFVTTCVILRFGGEHYFLIVLLSIFWREGDFQFPTSCRVSFCCGRAQGMYLLFLYVHTHTHTHRGSLFVNGLMKEVTFCDLSTMYSQLVYNTINLTDQNKYCINMQLFHGRIPCVQCAHFGSFRYVSSPQSPEQFVVSVDRPFHCSAFTCN